MATQNCPRCKSDRIRQGYRSTSFLQKILFRYNLLCDECNWEFVGFAIPGTVSTKVKRRKQAANVKSAKYENIKSETISFTPQAPEPAILESHDLVNNNSEQSDSDDNRSERDFIVSETGKKKKTRIRKRARVKLS